MDLGFLSSISNIGTLLVSVIALVYAILEYRRHKKSVSTNLLCQYHQRYVSDKNIESVIQYMLRTAKVDENGEIVGFDETKASGSDPGIYEKEIFMRFYEELQLQIDDGNIDNDIARDMFSYYVLKFDEIKDFHKEITDYDNIKCWHHYKKFIYNNSKLVCLSYE